MRNSRVKTLRSKVGWSSAQSSTSNRAADPISLAQKAAPLGGHKISDAPSVNVVDLFCGCGGLSLGFDLYDGPLRFRTVLGIDNDTSSLRVFNQNKKGGSGGVNTGRKADLTWFHHPSEVLLYYLAHFARWSADEELDSALVNLRYHDFLSRMRGIDEHYAIKLKEIASQVSYKRAASAIDPKAGSLALVKSVLSKLGLLSFTSATIETKNLPWTEEYLDVPPSKSGIKSINQTISFAKHELWQKQQARLKEAASRSGRGQTAAVAGRAKQVAEFLASKSGESLRDVWCQWVTARDTERATFCLSVQSELEHLYRDGRTVGLVLGGPPCKGWSRIGRAVIQDLRDQGAHAWASHQFGDERNELLHNYVLFIKALAPEAFLFENVAHFESTLKTPAGQINAADELEAALNLLTTAQLQYEVQADIIAARDFGIPQDRHRYIMVGLRRRASKRKQAETLLKTLRRYDEEVPLRAALQGLEDPAVFVHGQSNTQSSSWEVPISEFAHAATSKAEGAFLDWLRRPVVEHSTTRTDAHIVRASRRDDEEFYRYLGPGLRWMDYKFERLPILERIKECLSEIRDAPALRKTMLAQQRNELTEIIDQIDSGFLLRLLLEGSASRCGDVTHHLLSAGYLSKGHDRHGDWLERLSPDRPCKTIVSHIGKDTYGYIHPTQPRALSIREAARVQTFPDAFKFGNVGIVDAYSMIGNAVPPMLSYELARAMVTIHEANEIFSREVKASAASNSRSGSSGSRLAI